VHFVPEANRYRVVTSVVNFVTLRHASSEFYT
jgi:hypothetical protein